MLRFLKCESVTVKQNEQAVATCARHGLKVVGSLIFASPGETLAEMRDTIAFIDYTKKAGADRIWSFVMTPFPGTRIWEIAKERGKVSDDMDFDLLSHQAVDNPLLLDATIEKEAFQQVFNEGRKHLHYYKWKKVFSMFRNSPLRTIVLVFSSPWEHLKRGLSPAKE